MEKGLYGSKEWIYVDRSRERKLPFLDDTIGWSTFGDLKTMGYAEWFTLVRDLNFYRKEVLISERLQIVIFICLVWEILNYLKKSETSFRERPLEFSIQKHKGIIITIIFLQMKMNTR